MRRGLVHVCVLVLVIVLISASLYLVTRPKISVTDAYCFNGYFNFTLENLGEEGLSVTYVWTLNDPKADEPVLQGEGATSLHGGEAQVVSIFIDGPQNTTEDYDARFYVMYITIIEDGDTILEYREQKSTYDWDYSTLPPTPIDD